MEWIAITVGILLLITGIVGSVLPVIPGPPLSYMALLVAFIHEDAAFSMADNGYKWLFVLGLFAIGITLLDYWLPIYGTKKYGGTKAGTWGSAIGLVVGLVFSPALGPFGIIVGPFIGAVVGELLAGQTQQVAWRSGWGSFLGFLGGTFLKVTYGIVVAIYWITIIW